MAKCFCCKKDGFILDDMTILRGSDGQLMALCNMCKEDIRNSFRYYIDGKPVSKDEFDEYTKGGDS